METNRYMSAKGKRDWLELLGARVEVLPEEQRDADGQLAVLHLHLTASGNLPALPEDTEQPKLDIPVVPVPPLRERHAPLPGSRVWKLMISFDENGKLFHPNAPELDNGDSLGKAKPGQDPAAQLHLSVYQDRR